jgi:hypothetical protein
VVSYPFTFGIDYDQSTADNNWTNNTTTTVYGAYEVMTIDKNVNFYYDQYLTVPVEDGKYLSNQYYRYYIQSGILNLINVKDSQFILNGLQFSTSSRQNEFFIPDFISNVFTYPVAYTDVNNAITGFTGSTYLINSGYNSVPLGYVITGYSFFEQTVYTPSYSRNSYKIDSATGAISGPRIKDSGALALYTIVNTGVTNNEICYDAYTGATPNLTLYTYDYNWTNNGFVYTDDQLETLYSGTSFYFNNAVWTVSSGQIISGSPCTLTFTVAVSSISDTDACIKFGNNDTITVWSDNSIFSYDSVTPSNNIPIYYDYLLTSPVSNSWISDGTFIIQTDSNGSNTNYPTNC